MVLLVFLRRDRSTLARFGRLQGFPPEHRLEGSMAYLKNADKHFAHNMNRVAEVHMFRINPEMQVKYNFQMSDNLYYIN